MLHEKIKRGVYVIAEIGINHGGSLDTAREMIESAAACGVDAVKLQKRRLESMPQELRERPRTDVHAFGATEWTHRAALEFDVEMHHTLRDHAHAHGVEYGLSTWDMQSTIDCRNIEVDWIKVPSALNGDEKYLEHVACYPRPLLVSTGMLDEPGVTRLTRSLAKRMNNKHLMLCTSSYPCEAVDTQLPVIAEWLRWYDKDAGWESVGFSGHHRGTAIDIAAATLGARVIERHFTLDRMSKGTDHASSIEPGQLSKLVRDLDVVMAALSGDGLKRIRDCEQASIKKLRR